MAQNFKMVGQKTPNGKIILVAVVNEDFFDENFTGREKIKEIPEIFETICVKQTPNIYSGTYPNIRVSMDEIKDITDDFKGKGINGILTSNEWFCGESKDFNDILGTNI